MVLLVAGLLTWQMDYLGVTQVGMYVAVWTLVWEPGQRYSGNSGNGWVQ